MKVDLFEQWKDGLRSRAWLETFAARRRALEDNARITSEGRQIGTTDRGNMKYMGSVPPDLYWQLRALHGDKLDTSEFWATFLAEHPTFATKEAAPVGDRAWFL